MGDATLHTDVTSQKQVQPEGPVGRDAECSLKADLAVVSM
jgi:hypothetical protein